MSYDFIFIVNSKKISSKWMTLVLTNSVMIYFKNNEIDFFFFKKAIVVKTNMTNTFMHLIKKRM